MNKIKQTALTIPIVLQGSTDRGIDCIQVTDLTQEGSWHRYLQQVTAPAPPVDTNADLQPGLLYIISNSTFDSGLNLPPRNGTKADIERLTAVSRKYHLSIHKICEKTHEEIQDVMKGISTQNFEKIPCLVIVILSHGFDRNGLSMIAAKDKLYYLDNHIKYKLLRSTTLVRKLKLIVVDTCRDSESGAERPVADVSTESPTVPSAELLVFHSCGKGGQSLGDPLQGSYFIRVFCDNLGKYGMNKTVTEICDMTISNICQKYRGSMVPERTSTEINNFTFGHYVRRAS